MGLLFSFSFAAAKIIIDPEANYKIINCKNEEVCWGTDTSLYHTISDVAKDKCSLYTIIDVSSFEQDMVLIRTSKNTPGCSECNLFLDGTSIYPRAYEHIGEGIRVIPPFDLLNPPLENICHKFLDKSYKFVRA